MTKMDDEMNRAERERQFFRLRRKNRWMNARTALAIATDRTTPLPFQFDDHGRYQTERDGFTIDVRIVIDEDAPHIGSFSDDYSDGAVINPDSWRLGAINPRVFRYYHPLSGTVAEHRRGLRQVGMSKHEADVTARGYVFAELKEAREPNAVGVIVKVSRAGVELGESSCWGITGDNRDELMHYIIRDIAPDEIDEAMAEARRTLIKLCNGTPKADAA